MTETETKGYASEAEGYAASLRQQATWVRECNLDGTIDADELDAAATFIEQDRRILPQRRRSENFVLPWGGLDKPHYVTVGYFEDGTIGEIFVGGGKSGEQIEAIARDGAIILSVALQFGASLAAISHAITRDAHGEPQTIVGAVIDELMKEIAT